MSQEVPIQKGRIEKVDRESTSPGGVLPQEGDVVQSAPPPRPPAKTRIRRKPASVSPQEASPDEGSHNQKVGYKNPPKDRQFQPGQSGNPKGRPKGRKNVLSILEEVLYRPVKYTENGKQSSMPAIKAIMMKLLKLSLEGNLGAFDKLTKHFPLLQTAMETKDNYDGETISTENDVAILKEFSKMLEDKSLGGGANE